MNRKATNLCFIATLFIFGLFASSCAGVKSTVMAPKITEPVSYTGCVFDKEGRILHANEQTIVKSFMLKKSFWAMFYRQISLTNPKWDISEDLKKQIDEVDGNAIVNLRVKLVGNYGYWYLSALVPIIPDVQKVIVEGDVARFPE